MSFTDKMQFAGKRYSGIQQSSKKPSVTVERSIKLEKGNKSRKDRHLIPSREELPTLPSKASSIEGLNMTIRKITDHKSQQD